MEVDDSIDYVIKTKKTKCYRHYNYIDILNSDTINKKGSDYFFKPCSGHYHTVRNNKTIIICTNSKCVKKQKKYLKQIDLEDFFFYCSNPYCY